VPVDVGVDGLPQLGGRREGPERDGGHISVESRHGVPLSGVAIYCHTGRSTAIGAAGVFRPHLAVQPSGRANIRERDYGERRPQCRRTVFRWLGW